MCIHISTITISPGQQINNFRRDSFRPSEGSRGKKEARPRNGEWELYGVMAGTPEAQDPAKVGNHEGFLKNINHHGHGFITCTDFPEDVFVHKKVMERCKLSLSDEVRFNVHFNAQNTPQCSAPVWVKKGMTFRASDSMQQYDSEPILPPIVGGRSGDYRAAPY